MRVLIADALPEAGLQGFEQAGYEVTCDPALADDALAEAIRAQGADVLVVRSTKVPRAALEAGRLGLVIRAGAGYNNVDVEAASELGIYVANCPGKNAVAVAELTLGLILALDRRIPDCVEALRAGRWNKKRFAKAEGLLGRTLGIVGMGEIGRQVAARAKAFGMPVVAWSRSLTPERAEALGVGFAAEPREVAARADVVSVHVALTSETRGMIGAPFFGAMREGALFINTSRGDVVDGDALRGAIASRGIRCGLDVWNRQPKASEAPFDDPLGALPEVYGTHHIGASTAQAQRAVAAEAVRVARVYRETGEVPNCVNLAARSSATTTLVVRHLDQVGVLAEILSQLKAAEINVQEMENVIFRGARAACATIHLDTRPAPALLEALAASERVLGVRLA
jgi:D-3-phosphoglycerate dehydrogenase